MESAAEIWSKSVSKLPKNIYNFSISYVNNSLANAPNMHKWGKTTSSLCLHCNKNQTLGPVVAGCETSLREKPYNYRHDSILLNLVRILESIKSIDKDITVHKFSTMVTGKNQRPDLTVISNNELYL